MEVRAVGALATMHDSRFDAHCGIGHHPQWNNGGGPTVVLPPAGQERSLRLAARERSRVLHAVTGPGLGFERA